MSESTPGSLRKSACWFGLIDTNFFFCVFVFVIISINTRFIFIFCAGLCALAAAACPAKF